MGIQGNNVRLQVSVQDEPEDGQREPNVVRVPISVIILDENDNQPVFQGTTHIYTIKTFTFLKREPARSVYLLVSIFRLNTVNPQLEVDL